VPEREREGTSNTIQKFKPIATTFVELQ
jgi:hypothetical protein